QSRYASLRLREARLNPVVDSYNVCYLSSPEDDRPRSAEQDVPSAVLELAGRCGPHRQPDVVGGDAVRVIRSRSRVELQVVLDGPRRVYRFPPVVDRDLQPIADVPDRVLAPVEPHQHAPM